MQLILQPASDAASRRNLQRTVYRPFPVSDVSGLLEPEQVSMLRDVVSNGGIRLWGAKPAEDGRNVRRWERIDLGDRILLATGPGHALLSQVIGKFHNRSVARSLWGSTTTANGIEQTWEYIMVLDAPREVTYDKAELNSSIGRQPSADIREFVVLGEEQSSAALRVLGLSTDEVAETNLTADDLQRFEKLDQARTATGRVEQALIRKYLAAGETGDCTLCGRTFPVELLVAAHIKRRSLCSDFERRDFHNNVMLACRFGCDELFERGWVFVDAAGILRASARLAGVPSVRSYAEAHLLGRSVSHWLNRPGSRQYFDAHASTAVDKVAQSPIRA